MKQDNNKLEEAFYLLGKEFKSELPPVYLRHAFKSGKVNEKQIYEALEETSFKSKQGKREKPTPSWIKDAIYDFKSDLLRTLPSNNNDANIDVWSVAPSTYTRIPIFRDYLVSMETFIKAEIEARERELREVQEKFEPDEWGPPIEWTPASDALESVEDFAYILRNSFFTNLVAYSEFFLVELYSQHIDDIQEDIPRNSVIEFTASALVKPLKMKTPHWDVVVHKYTGMRNCILHNDGFLNESDKKHRKILDYIKKSSSIRAEPMRNTYGEFGHERIFLTKDFCEEALHKVEDFLLAVDFLSKQLRRSSELGKSKHHE